MSTVLPWMLRGMTAPCGFAPAVALGCRARVAPTWCPALPPCRACSTELVDGCTPADGDGKLTFPGTGSNGTAAAGAAAAPLPPGDVRTAWSVGGLGQCARYDEATASWRNDSILPYSEWGR